MEMKELNCLLQMYLPALLSNDKERQELIEDRIDQLAKEFKEQQSKDNPQLS